MPSLAAEQLNCRHGKWDENADDACRCGALADERNGPLLG
jgi:hypothetical protein